MISMKVRRVISFINKNYSVERLLDKYFGINISPGGTFQCPFHSDNRKSAKLYSDNAFFCFACCKQFRAYDVLIGCGKKEDEIAALVPEEFRYVEESTKKFDIQYYRAVTRAIGSHFKSDGNLKSLVENWMKTLRFREAADK